MNRILLAAIGCVAGSGTAAADPCSVAIEANDMLQYSTHALAVPASCRVIELTLHHTGKQPARVMGHNWVLTRDADMTAVVRAGMNAGFSRNYQPEGDPRIIAATPIVGGGGSTTVRIDTSRLTPGASYTYFCSTPGHAVAMKGRLSFGMPGTLNAANRKP